MAEEKKRQEFYDRLTGGSKNISFSEFGAAAEAFGFEFKRQKGSHMVYWNPEIKKSLNMQKMGGKAKPYQVRQLVKLIDEYGLLGKG